MEEITCYLTTKSSSLTALPEHYYSDQLKDHFYTITFGSYATYGKETSPGFVFTTNPTISGKVPLFRFFNKKTGDHFYSTTFVFTTATDGTVPLHRYYNASTAKHFYSITPINSQDWIKEEDAGYVYPESGADTEKFFRFYSPALRAHYYSIIEASPVGFKSEGNEGVVYSGPGPDNAPLYRYYQLPPPPDEGR